MTYTLRDDKMPYICFRYHRHLMRLSAALSFLYAYALLFICAIDVPRHTCYTPPAKVTPKTAISSASRRGRHTDTANIKIPRHNFTLQSPVKNGDEEIR